MLPDAIQYYPMFYTMVARSVPSILCVYISPLREDSRGPESARVPAAGFFQKDAAMRSAARGTDKLHAWLHTYMMDMHMCMYMCMHMYTTCTTCHVHVRRAD